MNRAKSEELMQLDLSTNYMVTYKQEKELILARVEVRDFALEREIFTRDKCIVEFLLLSTPLEITASRKKF